MAQVYSPFRVGVIGLEHGHINGMCEGLKSAGAEISKVFDEDAEKCREFKKSFPESEIAERAEDVYQDEMLAMILC